MTLGGLFSGIGGFELAATRAGITPVWSNEIDPFCCKVLRKNFSHEIIEDDIRNCGAGRKRELSPVDIVAGGFPCQPFSLAGKREGQNDDRYLWPEMLRTIREVRPAWVVGENVAGITSMDGGTVFDEICTSLENEGYQTQAYIIPACAVGAPHRRDRIWIIAHAIGGGRSKGAGRAEWPHENARESNNVDSDTIRNSRRPEGEAGLDMDRDVLEEARRQKSAIRCQAHHRDAANTQGKRFREAGNNFERSKERIAEQDTASTDSDKFDCHLAGFDSSRIPQQQKTEIQRSSADSNIERLEKRESFGSDAQQEQSPTFGAIWATNWMEVATGLCRVDDGVPAWVDSSRTNRLKALGNAIVPQVAQVIFEAIIQFENSK